MHSLDVAAVDDLDSLFLTSPPGDIALLGVLLLEGEPDLVLGEACLTRVCFRGSERTVAPRVLVGVVSREDLLPRDFVTVVVVRFVTTACLLPLVSDTVRLSPALWASLMSSTFLLDIAVCALVPKVAVVSPGSMPLRAVLVRPEAEGDIHKCKS